MSELPKGWQLSTLGEVCSHPQYGYTTSSTRTGKTRFLRTTDISSGSVNWDAVPYCEEEPKDVGKYLIRENDILVSRAGSVGLSYLVDKNPNEKSVFASYLIRFNVQNEIEPRYVSHFLKSRLYWSFISESSAGIAVPNVNATKLAELPIPLAPLNEQKRIVAKLDELLPKVEACKERLEKIPTILKRFRQSVLAAAVSGKLTEEWRKENQLATGFTVYESLSLLMKDEKKPEADSEIQELLDEIQDEVPCSWKVCMVGEVAKVSLGGTPSRKNPEYWNGNIPWISSGEVANCEIYDTEEKITELGLNNSNAKLLNPGTVLVAMIGEGKTRGQAAILRISATSNQNSAALVFNQELLLPEFVYFWLLCRYEQTRSGGRGGNQPALNGGKVRQLPFVVPPVAEQREIVRLLGDELNKVNKMTVSIKKAHFYVNRTVEAILSKAFSGELVPQDPNDEPASVLLERIKAEAPTKSKKISKKQAKVKAESAEEKSMSAFQ